MRGILNKYWMHVTLAYDPSDDTVRLLPGKSNTLFPAKTDCGLRRWVKIDQIGQAARSAVNDFHNQVLGTIAIGSAAVYIMSQEKASNRVSSCTQDALVHYAANSATKAVLSNPVAQSAAASALAQAYNGSVSGGRVVKDVAVSLFKQELAKKDPAYAYAFSSASFLVCAFNQ
ncbi:MAG: hypothetical protein DM484_05470 [Candidatus Methylumidiphilus alinenensis]|uniref:Uncharacterized protein n=1 Tax=Candidatus Methylumidiphilus alinenensis TaxID=2202197 RepID=A0A2W4RTR8_9GAMM|nr:MAG: hypothetical protein DM484_05470 [Candidatus Methylumidiphilus alinenensis]